MTAASVEAIEMECRSCVVDAAPDAATEHRRWEGQGYDGPGGTLVMTEGANCPDCGQAGEPQ